MTAGDGRDLLRYGAPTATLILFGAIAVPAGLFLWHRAGRPRVSSGSTGPAGRSGPET